MNATTDAARLEAGRLGIERSGGASDALAARVERMLFVVTLAALVSLNVVALFLIA